MIDIAKAQKHIDQCWGDEIVPTSAEYIKIPNKSPAFDPDWAAHGYMEEAVCMFERWARAKLPALPGASLETVRLAGRTPVVLIDVPGDSIDTALLYGHLDKQPEMVGWTDGFRPWVPRIEGDKLYGRGGADDGYAMFGALSALLAMREQGVPHARCVVLIEACEESGSYDLPYYVDHLAARLGKPSLVVCLDSGCGNYDQLWLTTSLRGMTAGILEVRVLDEGVHSGDASGVVPSSFRILRQLLSRLEDEDSGAVRPPELYAQIPAERVAQARHAASALGAAVHTKFPFVSGMSPACDDLTELVLNRTWRPQLAVIGMDGLPSPGDAGNVLLPYTRAQLSLRPPPTLDAETAAAALLALLERDPPYDAHVGFDLGSSATGWHAPAVAPCLEQSLARAWQVAFGAPPAYMGEGGTIPFMAMLGEKFPQAQFVVTGVLGPHSNAHGPKRIPPHSDRPARYRRYRPGPRRPPYPFCRGIRVHDDGDLSGQVAIEGTWPMSEQRSVRSIVETTAAPKTILQKLLDGVERVGNKVPHPAVIFFILAGLVILLSHVMYSMGASVTYEVVDPQTHKVEMATTAVRSLLTADGIRFMLTSMVRNFASFGPVAIIFVVMVGVGLAEQAGLMTALIKKIVQVTPRKAVTWILVTLGVVSSVASDAGYLVLIPLGAAAFLSLGRHPLAGLAAAFAGVAGVFGVNFLIAPIDGILTEITNDAIHLLNPAHSIGLTANFYFAVVSSLVLIVVCTLVTERIVEPRLGEYRGEVPAEGSGEVSPEEARGLRFALYALVASVIVIALWTFPAGAPLRDPQTGAIMGDSPFMNSLIVLIMLVFLAVGIGYGVGAKTITSMVDGINAVTKTFAGLSGLIFLLFVISQFLAYFNTATSRRS